MTAHHLFVVTRHTAVGNFYLGDDFIKLKRFFDPEKEGKAKRHKLYLALRFFLWLIRWVLSVQLQPALGRGIARTGAAWKS